MPFEMHPLEGLPFGAIVTKLDPADIAVPEVRKALYDLWLDKGLLIFRDVPGGAETQMALSHIFGEPEPHPMRDPKSKEGTPELADIRYDPDSGDIVNVNGVRKGAYLPWHFDMVYLPTINRGGILRAVTRAKTDGETGFIDGAAIYDALPEKLRARIEGLYVTYHFHPDMNLQRYAKEPGMVQERIAERSQKSFERMKLPPVAHPLVFAQAETGRQVLNFSPWFATGIEGLDQDEGDAILGQIAPYFLDKTRAYFHSWERDDMVLWDNWRMLHCALGMPVDQSRHVQRTTILGDYALGRIANSVPQPEPA